MMPFAFLPSFLLQPGGEVTAQFLAAGIREFRGAARHVYHLPYGRNSDRANFRLVLSEGRGTCSTKHALLAQLAKEQGRAIALTLGLYEMTERNTPGVGPVLEKYGLPCLPEMHCYLTYQEIRVDITRAERETVEPIERFLYEETITPEQIGSYKVELHKRFLRAWVVSAGAVSARGWEEIWQIREECIAALSK